MDEITVWKVCKKKNFLERGAKSIRRNGKVKR